MDRAQIKKRVSLFSVFLTFGIDNLGATIVFPIFAPLFLEPSRGLLGPDISLAYKTGLLGVFLSIFPLIQFFFSPILGEYSDHYGRKRAFLLTTFLTFVGFALLSWGIHIHSLFWIFISRMIMGLGAGNFSICLSTLSDLSPSPCRKLRYYGYGAAVGGFSFILGTFLGGRLSDTAVNPLFSSSFPILLGTILAIFNVLLIVFGFVETIRFSQKTPFELMKGIRNIQMVFKTPLIKNFYLIYLFYLFSWNIIYLFIPAFLIQMFHATSSRIGDVAAIMGGCWIFGTGVIHRLFAKTFYLHSKKILILSFALFASLIICAPLFSHVLGFVIVLGCCAFISSLVWPLCAGEISNVAPIDFQGKAFGLSQSLLSLTMVLSALIGGFFLHTHPFVPFILSSISALIALLILSKTKVGKYRESN